MIKFNIYALQVLIAVGFFVTIMPLTLVAVVGFDVLEMNDPLTQTLITIWTMAIIPITIYITIFTKFNNPFKREVKSK